MLMRMLSAFSRRWLRASLALAVLGAGMTAAPAARGVLLPPTLTKAFGAGSIAVGGTTSLTFTVTNPNVGALTAGVAFTDTLPSGLVVATPNGLTGSCGGGTITATAGGTSISLSGATLAGSASCTFSVNVAATTVGVKVNTTSTITSTSGGGVTGSAATASITVTAAVPVMGPVALALFALLLAGAAALLVRHRGLAPPA
jgi:uncharacterized repeat protein (TIGR01451 family)